ncbi:3-hydroxybutyryl-CoA dehydrogenase [Providencia alcalifaciens]
MSKQKRTFKAVSIDSEIFERIEKLRQQRAEKDYLIKEAPMTQLIRGLLNEALRREGV